MDKWPPGVDPHGNGIRVRVYRKGKCVYNKTLPGDPYSAADIAAAVKHREVIKSRVTLGLPLIDGEQTANALFSEVAQEYLNTLQSKHSTLVHYRNILQREWMPLFGNWFISEPTATHIKTHLTRRVLSAKSKKNILIPLRCVFTFAIESGLRKDNPATGVKVGKQQTPPVERFSPREREKILGRLEGAPLLYFSLMFATGLRPGELLGLKWADWDGEQLHVRRQITTRRIENSTKTHKRRFVYVPKWARGLLTNSPTRFTGDWVFQTRNGDYLSDTDVFNVPWRKALAALKIDYRVPYVCRHTRAAELLSTGVEPGKAAQQMGHTLEMFYRTYAEWIDEFSGDREFDKLEGHRSETGLNLEKYRQVIEVNGDPEGTRTPDLRRDRAAF
jgi:integrase